MNVIESKMRNSDKILIAIFSCILLFLSLKNLHLYNEIVVLNDEFGYWGIAASLAGHDWKELMSITPYYGFGYPLLLACLIKIGLPMAYIYKLAIVGNSIMLIGSYLLAIFCGCTLFSRLKKYLIFIAAFITMCYSNTLFQTQIAWTETFLYFLFWLSIALLILVEQKTTIFRLTGFALTVALMFAAHQRTLGILIASVMVVMLLILKRKIRLKQIIVLTSFSIIFGFFIIFFKNRIQATYWTNSIMSKFNDFSTTSSSLWSMMSLHGIKGVLEGTIGRIFYFLVAGGIVFLSGFWYTIITALEEVKRNFFGDSTSDKYSFTHCFILLSFLGSLGIAVLFMLNNYTRLDIIVYGRYIENTIGPFLLFGICMIFEYGLSKCFTIIYTVLILSTGGVTYNYLTKVESDSFVDVASIGASRFFNIFDRHAVVFAMIIFALICAYLFYFFSLKKKNVFMGIVLIVIAMTWLESAQFVLNKIVFDIQAFRTKENENVAQALSDSEVQEIYYILDEDPYGFNIKYLQYWIPDIKVRVIDKEEFESIPKDAIWFIENTDDEYRLYVKDAVINKKVSYTIATQKNSKWKTVIENIE